MVETLKLDSDYRERHKYAHYTDGIMVEGSFCSVCFEAIRMVELMS
jgi:hypothetical protein